MDESHNFRLHHPYGMLVIGPSQVGKTTWLLKAITSPDMIQPPHKEIYYFYTEHNKAFEDYPSINFIEGFDPTFISKEFLSGKEDKNICLVLDDFQDSAIAKDLLSSLFLRVIHHRGVSCVATLQTAFPRQLNGPELSRNCTYKCIFKNASERSETNMIGSKMFPRQSKYWGEVVDFCHGSGKYIFLDLHWDCPQQYRVRTGVLPGEEMIIFTPNKLQLR